MDSMEQKLGAILNNPQLMQQIMAMANSMTETPSTQEAPPPALPDLNPAMLQKVVELTGKIGLDGNQKTLLCALQPYLQAEKIQKLERAMRASKLADLASIALSSGALSALTGR